MIGTEPLATVGIFRDRREGVNQGKRNAMRSGLRVGALAAGMVAAAAGLTAAAELPKAASTYRTQLWHVQLPRPQLLAAWTRLKSLPVTGVPVDMRFRISGAAFHVSPTGDDVADGSRAKPWRTLQHAVSQLRPNTVIYLDAGTYYGPVVVQTQASADAPAAIRAAEGQHVIVTYPDDFAAAEKAKVHSAPTEGRTRAMDEKSQELHYPPLIDVRGRFIEISGLHLVGSRDRLPQNLYSENGVSFSGNVFDHNCLVPGVRLGKLSPLDTVGSKNVQVTPMVIDARSFDFRLGRRSPCMNAGADVGLEFQGRAPGIGLSESR